jgi:hypothetical protein
MQTTTRYQVDAIPGKEHKQESANTKVDICEQRIRTKSISYMMDDNLFQRAHHGNVQLEVLRGGAISTIG